MKYNEKENLYYYNEEELVWLIENKKIFRDYSSDQLKINNWRGQLNKYFDSSLIQKRKININEASNKIIKKLKIKLNIDSFINMNLKNIEEWKRDILINLDEYLKNNFLIKSKIISVQFIGSLGSKDPINYSDFDCVIILPDNNILDDNIYYQIKKLIFNLRILFYSYDPNQHHDIFILTENELAVGIKPFYPLILFSGKWGYGREYFYTLENNIYPIKKYNFINNNQFFRRMYHQKDMSISIYNYKYILSSAYMTPVYFYNFNNKFYSKSESIRKVIDQYRYIKNEFSMISNYRSNWPPIKKSYTKYFLLKYGSKFLSYNQLKYFNRRLEFYFVRNSLHLYVKLNDISSIIKIARKISDYLLGQLILNEKNNEDS